jgi:dynein heavy chain 1
MRSYQVYEVYTEHIKNYKKFNDVCADLREDAMKAKHWKDMLNKLKIMDRGKSEIIKRENLTLSHLWCADLLGRSKVVNDVLTQARGEKILEDFINKIKETWAAQEVELVAYQKKCKLIKGWDDLFTLVDEHTNTISSMKMSPYFKVFEKDIEPWSKTLDQIRVIFDSWIDVQKKYVYLEGIFFGSADIKSMLANEFNKFKNIDSEFIKLMKAVNKEPKVLEILKINNLEKTLVNFITQLEHI